VENRSLRNAVTNFYLFRASLPVIISLLSLWIILFLFFAILYIEVFSMTKWESGEDRNRNFATMGAALVMLAFMTTG
jgi:voltage-dependent calcium channel